MVEATKLPSSGLAAKDDRRTSAPFTSYKQKYTLPLPIRTFPLPAFNPGNPLSLLHLAVVWLGQVLYPPTAEPSVLFHGVWSLETRSVHITDPKSMNDLWCQGFFGKGSLSRSEPSWLNRELSRRGLLGETSEQRTAKRREQRADTKWERGRSELEAVEQKRRQEEEEEASRLRQRRKPNSILDDEKTSTASPPICCPASVVLPPAIRPPVGPLELLALPNSEADLKPQMNHVHAKAGTEALLLTTAVKNAASSMKAGDSHAAPSMQDFIINGSAGSLADRAETAHPNGENNPLVASLSDATAKDIGETADVVDGDDCAIQPPKRQKSVRFSPEVTSTTFQHSDPPSPNRSAVAAPPKGTSSALSANDKATVNTAVDENSAARVASLSSQREASREASGKSSIGASSSSNGYTASRSSTGKTTASPGYANESPRQLDVQNISNKEHLQLSAEEAFFLVYALGTLDVADPKTKAAMTTQQLFTLFRQFSYFPPRTPNMLSTDDPFLVHFAVYFHFRSLGWVPRHGIKFGVDWLLYGKGPALDHAEFGLMVMPSYTDPEWKKCGRKALSKPWHWLHSVNRVLTTVYKSLVLVYVDIPPPSCELAGRGGGITDLLRQFKIREVPGLVDDVLTLVVCVHVTGFASTSGVSKPLKHQYFYKLPKNIFPHCDMSEATAASTPCGQMGLAALLTAVFIVARLVYARWRSNVAATSTTSTSSTALDTDPEKLCLVSEASPQTAAAAAAAAPPMFILVGDSTTADQAADGGGWGAGFLSFLARGGHGVNFGRNGATTLSYLKSGLWETVLDTVCSAADAGPVYVTIQFGHNDQNPSSGVSLEQYQTYLVKMARDVIAAGGTPILVTPLARRDFDSDNQVVDNLADHRAATLAAYHELVAGDSDGRPQGGAAHHARCINLNAASLAYVAAIGYDAAQQYNLNGPDSFDTTHLNDHGSIVFGRIVADLILGHPPVLVSPGQRDSWTPGKGNDDGISAWIRPSPFLTSLIWHGKPA